MSDKEQTQTDVQDDGFSDEESAGFDEAMGSVEKSEDPDKSDSGETQEEKEAPEEDTGDEKTEEEEEQPAVEEEKPKTAKELAEARASRLMDPDEGQAEEEEEPAPERKQQKRQRQENQPVAFELTDDDLPEGEVEIAGQKINLREYREDYPEDYAAMLALAGVVARKIVGQGQKEEPAQRQQYQQEVDGLKFWFRLMSGEDGHPDAIKIAESKEFDTWLGKQSKGIQRLSSSPDVDDAKAVLSMFKEEIAAKKVKDHDANSRIRKQKKNDLHRGSIRGGGSKTDATGGKADDDEQAGFDSYVKQKR